MEEKASARIQLRQRQLSSESPERVHLVAPNIKYLSVIAHCTTNVIIATEPTSGDGDPDTYQRGIRLLFDGRHWPTA